MKIRENSTVTTANVTSSVRVGDTYIILTDLTLTVLDEATMPEFKVSVQCETPTAIHWNVLIHSGKQ